MSTKYDSPQKVCLICHGLGSGGIESFIVTLATGLKKRDYDVKLVMALDDNGVPQFREQDISNAGIEMFRTSDLGSIKRLCKHVVRLYKYLKKNDFDIVHSNMNMLNGLNLAIAWLAGVKIRVAHAHAVSSERNVGGKTDIIGHSYKLIMRLLVSLFANRKCGCSIPAVEYSYGRKSIGKANVWVINNGIDIETFLSRDNKPHSTKTLITVGRLVPIKNPELILQIMHILKDKGYKLIWVGAGELEENIRSEIQKLGLSQCITMLGARNDVNQLLQNASMFLLTSFSEGLSIATIEAQAAGLPCVISEAVPMEVDCGLCTFVSTNKSPETWAETIDTLATRDKAMALDMKKLEKFGVDHMIGQMIAMYGVTAVI